jgi:hypothetical protein
VLNFLALNAGADFSGAQLIEQDLTGGMRRQLQKASELAKRH